MNPKITTFPEKDPGIGLEAICQNRTLFIDQYSGDQPSDDYEAEPDNFCKTAKKTQDVFDHYHPAINVTFQDADGNTIPELLRFNQLKDFEANGGEGNLVKNSEFLRGIKQEIDINSKVLDKLRGNKKLQSIINDPAAKKELITMLQSMIEELEQANN